jgi:hypothetical protein
MMGIESLQKAALAAGFAMATPDDDPPMQTHAAVADVQWARWRPAFLGTAPGPGGARDAIVAAVGWMKDHLPAAGGRAPA